MKSKITLAKDTIAKDDVESLIEWLKDYPRLTMGQLTSDFESIFARYIGSKHAVFVNSGSSAILLVIYSLMEQGILKKGDSVMLSALSWSTDFAPLIQLGLQPILVDTNSNDLSIDLSHAEDVMKKYKPKALLLVSVLGLVPDMKKIVELCDKHGVLLLEDACESLGSEFESKKIGSFGHASMFSTYFGHHISTIEGGVVCTDNSNFADMLKSLRSHGWSRDMSKESQVRLKAENSVSDFEELYTFYHCGFNVRPTDLHAYLGIRQMQKLQSYIDARSKNFQYYLDNIDKKFWKPQSSDRGFCSNFAYPVISSKRDEIVEKLRENNVEVRPLIAGSISKQPFYKNADVSIRENTPFADRIHDFGLYLPNHALLDESELERICSVINFIDEV